MLAPHRVVAEIEFGPQPTRPLMKGFELFANIFEITAFDVQSQVCRQAGQIMQCNGDGNSVRGRANTDFIVGASDLCRDADDLPGSGQPLDDQG